MKFIFTLILFIATNSFALLGYGTKDISGTSYILTNLGDVKRAAAKKVYLLPFASSAEIEKEYKLRQGAILTSLLEKHRGKICNKFEQDKTIRLNLYNNEIKSKDKAECSSEENQLAELQSKIDPNISILRKERELLTSKLTKLSGEYEVSLKLAEQIAAEKEKEIFDREFSKIKVIEEHHEDGYQTVFINNSKLALVSTHEPWLYFKVRPMVGDRLIQDLFVERFFGKGYDYGKERIYILPPNSKIKSEKKSYFGYAYSFFKDEEKLNSYLKSNPDVKTCTAEVPGIIFSSKREVPCITSWEIDKSEVKFVSLNIDESTGRLISFETDVFKKFAIEEVKENDSRLKAFKKISEELKQVKASLASVNKKLALLESENEKITALVEKKRRSLNICQTLVRERNEIVQKRDNLESLSCPSGNSKFQYLVSDLNNLSGKAEKHQIYLDKFESSPNSPEVWEKFVKDSATQETSTNVNGEFAFKDADEDSMIYSDFKFKEDLARVSRYWLVEVPKDRNYIELNDENTSAFVKNIFRSSEFKEESDTRSARESLNKLNRLLREIERYQ